MSIDLVAATRALSTPSASDRFDPIEVADLPEPVRRYRGAAAGELIRIHAIGLATR